MTATITFEVDGMALHLPDATGLAPLSLPVVPAETPAAPSQDAVNRFQAAMQDDAQPGAATAGSASSTAVLLVQLTSPGSLEHTTRAQEEPGAAATETGAIPGKAPAQPTEQAQTAMAAAPAAEEGIPAEAATEIAPRPPATVKAPRPPATVEAPRPQAQPAVAEAPAASPDNTPATPGTEAPAASAFSTAAVPEAAQAFGQPVVQTPAATGATPGVATMETPLTVEAAPGEAQQQSESAAAFPAAPPRESPSLDNTTPHTANPYPEQALPPAGNALDGVTPGPGITPVISSPAGDVPHAAEQPGMPEAVVNVEAQPSQKAVVLPGPDQPVAQEAVVDSEDVGETRPVAGTKAPTTASPLENLEKTEEDSGDMEQPAVSSTAAASVQTPAAAMQAAPVPVAMPALDGVARAPEAVSGAGMTSAQIAELVESVAAQIRVEPSLRSGEGTVVIQLKPTVLEGSRISLSAKDGALSVEIAPVATGEVVARIQNALPRLEAALASSIAEFHSISVSLRKDRKDETA